MGKNEIIIQVGNLRTLTIVSTETTVVNLIVFLINLQNIMCQIFTVQKYRFGNIISTPREMCVHELYTIESSNMTWKMKTSTRTINNYYSD